MKEIILLCAMVITCTISAQQSQAKKVGPPSGDANVGDTYGQTVKAGAEKKAMTAAQLTNKLKKEDKIANVAVTGKVTEVCDKKGCWMTVATDNDEKFFVKMKDYAFFVPTALVGKTVVLEGDAAVKVTSVEELQHYAEDAKKSEAEIAAITEPKKEIRFMASGIRVIP